MSLKRLRKLAELNLCEECYKKYTYMLEPSIRQLLLKPLPEWKDVESNITQMVMKLEGVFKDDLIIISFDEDLNENFADKLDVKAFIKIKHCSFKRKIDYLREHGILQASSYEFLDRVRKIRNIIIHDQFSDFSEQDRELFSYAHVITDNIYHATMFNLGEDLSAAIKSNAENFAEKLLLKLEGFYSSRKIT